MAASGYSVALVEHDIYGGLLCTWTYPGVSSNIQALCIKRCTGDNIAPFFYLKYKSDWIYVLTLASSQSVDPNLSSVSLCLITKSFNPEKFRSMLDILIYQHVSTGDPSRILEGYLSIFTTGSFTNSRGSFKASSFNDSEALRANCKLREIVNIFESDGVILWNAVLLKKRILIYADNVSKVLDIVRYLPCFALHRADTNTLRPLVTSDAEHVEDLQAAGVYIAGTTDDSLLLRNDLFDVIASVPNRRVNISESSADDMRMGALHRDILNIMIPCDGSANTLSDQELVDAISQKTFVAVERLRSMRQDSKEATEEAISSMVKNEVTSRWLTRLATAEGII
jgi:hypothetical protein